jgi:hypothetical protein
LARCQQAREGEGGASHSGGSKRSEILQKPRRTKFPTVHTLHHHPASGGLRDCCPLLATPARARACSHSHPHTDTQKHTHTHTHTHHPTLAIASFWRVAPPKNMNIHYLQALVTAKLLATSKLSMWGVSLNSEVEN